MMDTNYRDKSTVEEIKKRFEHDVERFSNLETAQATIIDAKLAMELITKAATVCTSDISHVLDIGCGAGNNTMNLLKYVSPFDCDLVDLSRAMLRRAEKRITGINTGTVRVFEGDFRNVDLPHNHYDVVISAAMLHHLRDDADWEMVFKKIYDLVAPGGSFWITDLVSHAPQPIEDLMWNRYGEYLLQQGGEEYRQQVFNYIEQEDTPRPLFYQLNLLRQVGFETVELLHKNSYFAAFGAIKGRQ